MFKPQEFEGRFIGYGLERAGRFYFFGGRGLTRADLPRVFPQYKFSFLKQIHSATVVEAEPSAEPEADAVFTSEPLVAVVAQSADCTPILLSSSTQVCAIHSGWRGTAQNIVRAVKHRCPEFNVDFAAIGPHILQNSFEVGLDTADSLDRSSPVPPAFSNAHGEGKCFYDLNRLVQAQLRAAFGPEVPIELCLYDTMTDLRFCSYRRDKGEAGRQYSFVVINAQKPGSILK